MGSGIFAGCTSLTSVTIPSSINAISTSAFSGCTALKNYKVPNNIVTIQGNAFYECESLESIILSPELKYINDYAFKGCNSLRRVVCLTNTSPKCYSAKAFYGVDLSNLTLEVPAGSKASYLDKNVWRNFGNIIETTDKDINDDTLNDSDVMTIGDVNNDGKVDVADIVDIINFSKDKQSVNFKKHRADANQDGFINLDDVEKIAKQHILLQKEPKHTLLIHFADGLIESIRLNTFPLVSIEDDVIAIKMNEDEKNIPEAT